MAWPPAKCALGEGKAGVLATRPAPRGWLVVADFATAPQVLCPLVLSCPPILSWTPVT